jgi:hypothetical protein
MSGTELENWKSFMGIIYVHGDKCSYLPDIISFGGSRMQATAYLMVIH